MSLLETNQQRCIQCGICAEVCPVGVLIKGTAGIEQILPQACIACGHCVAVCPQAAINNQKALLANQVTLERFPVLSEKDAREFLRSRRSVRRYKNTPVPRDQLLKLIDIARFAPTGSNSQGVSYIIIEDSKILRQATAATINWMEEQPKTHWSFDYHIRSYYETEKDPILRGAPHLILAVTETALAHARENTIFSFAYLELFAPALGLGSCWAGLFEMCAFANYIPLIKLFNIPKGKVITGAVMVGYPQYPYYRLVDRNPLAVTWM
ncbi:nitroreductase family protein [Sporomusa termitida]|uniref:Electron transport complex subunit RsxB n=1 Tax=Sporomusa termitida TaxID=2377 RepID=A0A517DTP5_9FIRM|nr:nitroreductase family protein [Sporomusa termitida]QDR80725.1 Electron transport complex subunit RsxB [Sporomusa termitida]